MSTPSTTPAPAPRKSSSSATPKETPKRKSSNKDNKRKRSESSVEPLALRMESPPPQLSPDPPREVRKKKSRKSEMLPPPQVQPEVEEVTQSKSSKARRKEVAREPTPNLSANDEMEIDDEIAAEGNKSEAPSQDSGSDTELEDFEYMPVEHIEQSHLPVIYGVTEPIMYRVIRGQPNRIDFYFCTVLVGPNRIL